MNEELHYIKAIITAIIVGIMPALLLFFFKRWITRVNQDFDDNMDNFKAQLQDLEQKQAKILEKLHKLEIDLVKGNKTEQLKTEIKYLERQISDTRDLIRRLLDTVIK